MTTKQAKQLIGKTVVLRHSTGLMQSCTVLDVKSENIKIEHDGMTEWLWTPNWFSLWVPQ